MENVIAVKQTTISVGLISIFTYLGIDAEVFWLYVLLLFIDFFTWFVKWIKNKELSSRTAINWFFSKLTLLLLILSIWVFGKINDYNMAHILSWIFFALSLAELYSIISNIYEIYSGKKVKEYDAVSIILRGILNIIKNKIDKLEYNEITNGKNGDKQE